jgi:hypothetical protein
MRLKEIIDKVEAKKDEYSYPAPLLDTWAKICASK